MAHCRCIATILALTGLTASANAHHSWSGVYNRDETITVEGIVDEFRFQTPHLALVLDVQNDAGEIEQWTVEWSSPRRFSEAGYDRNTLAPGDELTVTGQPAWTPGRKSVRLRSLTRASDGFTLTSRGGARGRRNGR